MEKRFLYDGQGPRLNLFRALVDNDTWLRRTVGQTGLRDLSYTVKDISTEQLTSGIVRVRSGMQSDFAQGFISLGCHSPSSATAPST